MERLVDTFCPADLFTVIYEDLSEQSEWPPTHKLKTNPNLQTKPSASKKCCEVNSIKKSLKKAEKHQLKKTKTFASIPLFQLSQKNVEISRPDNNFQRVLSIQPSLKQLRHFHYSTQHLNEQHKITTKEVPPVTSPILRRIKINYRDVEECQQRQIPTNTSSYDYQEELSLLNLEPIEIPQHEIYPKQALSRSSFGTNTHIKSKRNALKQLSGRWIQSEMCSESDRMSEILYKASNNMNVFEGYSEMDQNKIQFIQQGRMI